MSLTISRGDITSFDGDAIVNAANSSLLGGGGVDGAIHRAAGPKLLEECRTLGGCPAGDAKITGGYKLRARHVIHTVGPVFSPSREDECRALLENCYRSSLSLAVENGCRSIAFPLISAGVFGYPKKAALAVAVDMIKRFGSELECSLVLFDAEACEIARRDFPEHWKQEYAKAGCRTALHPAQGE